MRAKEKREREQKRGGRKRRGLLNMESEEVVRGLERGEFVTGGIRINHLNRLISNILYHFLISLFLYFFISLFLYFFISLFLYFFISLFLYFFISLFL